MNLFRGTIDFAVIKREYEAGLKKLNPDVVTKMKGGKGNPVAFFNSKAYRIFTVSMFKAIRALETGKSKQYYKYLNQSAGDYSKRKGGNVQRQMISHAEFISDFIKKSRNEKLKYSLLGIFTDMWEILKDPKWVSAFRRSFTHVVKNGESNSIITSFKMIYLALVIAFEMTGLKMLYFEYDVHTGIDPEKSILNIMKQHSSFMKGVILPVIKVICICKNIKNPLDTVNELIKDENTAKAAQKKAKKNGNSLDIPEGMTAVEAYKVEMLDNSLKKKSTEVAGAATLFAAFSSFFGTLGSSAAAPVTIVTTTAAGATALAPVASGILIFTAIVILLIIAVPVARLIIYWMNVKKVDLQKELEMQAELLNNNIIQLQERLEKTSSEEERARLQNIINKQIEMLVDLQNKIKVCLNEEYEASVAAEQEVESDDSSQTKDYGDDSGNDDFEVSI
jgi:hypothetical protein